MLKWSRKLLLQEPMCYSSKRVFSRTPPMNYLSTFWPKRESWSSRTSKGNKLISSADLSVQFQLPTLTTCHLTNSELLPSVNKPDLLMTPRCSKSQDSKHPKPFLCWLEDLILWSSTKPRDHCMMPFVSSVHWSRAEA